MITQKLRRNGNSLVVTIPRGEVERLGLEEGEVVSIEVRKVAPRPPMESEIRAAFDAEFDRIAPALQYLADH